jgi:hypothetical protein
MRGGFVVTRGVQLAVCCVLVSGCARARLSQEPGLLTQPRQAAARGPVPRLSLTVHPRHLEFDSPAGAGFIKPWYKSKLRAELDAVLGEFPVLANASWDAPDAPYRLVIEATHAVRGSGMRNKIASTVHFLIPSSDTGHVELEADLFRGAQRLKSYEASGSYKSTRHLLFLLTPWLWRTGLPAAVMRDTFRDLLLQLERDAGQLFS